MEGGREFGGTGLEIFWIKGGGPKFVGWFEKLALRTIKVRDFFCRSQTLIDIPADPVKIDVEATIAVNIFLFPRHSRVTAMW